MVVFLQGVDQSIQVLVLLPDARDFFPLGVIYLFLLLQFHDDGMQFFRLQFMGFGDSFGFIFLL